MSAYRPIPVEAASRIAVQNDKDIVVIVAVDDAHQKTHFTTWGNTPQNKIRAANLATDIVVSVGESMEFAESFEDFRTVEAAVRAADIETLSDSIRWAIDAPDSQVSVTVKQCLQVALDKVAARRKSA